MYIVHGKFHQISGRGSIERGSEQGTLLEIIMLILYQLLSMGTN